MGFNDLPGESVGEPRSPDFYPLPFPHVFHDLTRAETEGMLSNAVSSFPGTQEVAITQPPFQLG